jgi:putative ATP-dependent endonuclease of OLD family
MQIVQLRIRNFRCIRHADILPSQHNVLLGPNNCGKTTVLEALNLLLNPETTTRTFAVDENDFCDREYLPHEQREEGATPAAGGDPHDRQVYVEAVLAGLSDEDESMFHDVLVPWRPDERRVIEATDEGQDPFEGGAVPAIRVFFEAWYDPEEDDFECATCFLRREGVHRDECRRFTREHKRQVGFLIYRDFRALTRPITLEPGMLFSRLLQSQEVSPAHFEEVLSSIQGCLAAMADEEDFRSLLAAYQAEIERFLALSHFDTGKLSFDLSDRSRRQLKEVAQLYANDSLPLPIQKLGAGTRSLAILAILTLIMRRRGRGILALEEPETFLFPHAQRRVIDECLSLATQTFVTTHSPFVLERMPVEAVGRIERSSDGTVRWVPLSTARLQHVNLYTRRLRSSHAEALVGRGVIVVEGDSDRWWLTGVSRILNRKTWNGRVQEALELQGIAVVNAESNSDVPRMAEFFRETGLAVVGVLDRTNDAAITQAVQESACPFLWLQDAGLESLLAAELPPGVLRRLLSEAPYSRAPLRPPAEVAAMADDAVRAAAREFLRSNKGSAGLHEWILSLLDEASVPRTLGVIVGLVSAYVTEGVELLTQTV